MRIVPVIIMRAPVVSGRWRRRGVRLPLPLADRLLAPAPEPLVLLVPLDVLRKRFLVEPRDEREQPRRKRGDPGPAQHDAAALPRRCRRKLPRNPQERLVIFAAPPAARSAARRQEPLVRQHSRREVTVGMTRVQL
jgi:hypothetical protein